MSTEAMKLALEALEGINSADNDRDFLGPEECCDLDNAITALQEALAQPQQEPVAWANPNDLQNFDMKVRTNAGPLHTVPLYISPPARKPLTKQQRNDIYNKCRGLDVMTAVLLTEAAHGIKGDA